MMVTTTMKWMKKWPARVKPASLEKSSPHQDYDAKNMNNTHAAWHQRERERELVATRARIQQLGTLDTFCNLFVTVYNNPTGCVDCLKKSARKSRSRDYEFRK